MHIIPERRRAGFLSTKPSERAYYCVSAFIFVFGTYDHRPWGGLSVHRGVRALSIYLEKKKQLLGEVYAVMHPF